MRFPGRLYHEVPFWVPEGSCFHIRVRLGPRPQRHLTEPDLGRALLDSARGYHQQRRWYLHLFLLMPDHLHALMAFPRGARMSRVVGDWKRFQRVHADVYWQTGYFDHRIRSDGEFVEKAAYIRRNPVVKGLCSTEHDWPWVLEPWREAASPNLSGAMR